MGYFPNGMSAEIYQAQFCDHCRHMADPEKGCAVWDAHIIHNYDECNNDGSILHMLIPRDGIENMRCAMFLPFDADRCTETHDLFGG